MDKEAVLTPEGANAEMIEYWNGTAGQRWVRFQDQLDLTLRPLGQAAMECGGVAAGDRVLDVGCGCGDTSIELAGRVAPTGSVLGVDISTTMLARARTRAAEIADARVAFENADAASHPLPAESFDLVFSRFGVMFFRYPEVAFANLRTALRPGGRIAFVCWQALKHNEWYRLPVEIAGRHVALPDPPPPGTPGPFAFADGDRVRGILSAAGFSDIALDSHERAMEVGGPGDVAAAVEFVQTQGLMVRLLQEADEDTRARVTADLRQALAPYHDGRAVRMGSASWLVTARRG